MIEINETLLKRSAVKFLIPFSITLALTTTVFANSCSQPNLTTDISTGLGVAGQACHLQTFRLVSPGLREWIIIGENPSPVITVTLDVSPLLGTNTAGGQRRAICSAFPANTMPEYSWGYAIPDWPDVILDQKDYDVPTSGFVTIRAQVRDVLHGFQEYSNISLNVFCLPRQF